MTRCLMGRACGAGAAVCPPLAEVPRLCEAEVEAVYTRAHVKDVRQHRLPCICHVERGFANLSRFFFIGSETSCIRLTIAKSYQLVGRRHSIRPVGKNGGLIISEIYIAFLF